MVELLLLIGLLTAAGQGQVMPTDRPSDLLIVMSARASTYIQLKKPQYTHGSETVQFSNRLMLGRTEDENLKGA